MGRNVEQLQEIDAKSARTSGLPRTEPEKAAYILQKVSSLADTRYGLPDVILPKSVLALCDRDAAVRNSVQSLQKNV